MKISFPFKSLGYIIYHIPKLGQTKFWPNINSIVLALPLEPSLQYT